MAGWAFGISILIDVKLDGGSRAPLSKLSSQLKKGGATICSRYKIGETTHILYKSGDATQARAAAKSGCSIVSMAWLNACVESQEHLNEDAYPVPMFDTAAEGGETSSPLCVDGLASYRQRSKKKRKSVSDEPLSQLDLESPSNPFFSSSQSDAQECAVLPRVVKKQRSRRGKGHGRGDRELHSATVCSTRRDDALQTIENAPSTIPRGDDDSRKTSMSSCRSSAALERKENNVDEGYAHKTYSNSNVSTMLSGGLLPSSSPVKIALSGFSHGERKTLECVVNSLIANQRRHGRKSPDYNSQSLPSAKKDTALKDMDDCGKVDEKEENRNQGERKSISTYRRILLIPSRPVTADATHIVVEGCCKDTGTSIPPRRTIRVIFGLLRGAAIVTSDFLAAALDGVTNELLVEAPVRFSPFLYKNSNADVKEQGKTSTRDWLPCTSRRTVLEHQNVYILKEQLDPPREVCEQIVELAGGKVVRSARDASLVLAMPSLCLSHLLSSRLSTELKNKRCVSPGDLFDAIEEKSKL